MALDPNLVRFAAKFISVDQLDCGQIEELSRLLGDRAELFAYLFTHPNFLRDNPDVKVELLRLAREHGHRASTKREAIGPPAVIKELVNELQKELLAKIALSPDHGDTDSRFDTVSRRLIRYAATGANHESSPEKWIGL